MGHFEGNFKSMSITCIASDTSGRFGNQVDQLLGVMQFARNLDRTLVLPNFIEYEYPKTTMVPFESIFEVSYMKKYVKVIRMSIGPVGVWMKQSAKSRPSLCPTKHGWMPPHRRSDKDCLALCWSPRKSLYDESAPVGCQAKEGNPFGPYWDKIGVSFAHDAYFGDLPGGYDLTKPGSKAAWLERYLKWTSRIMEKALQFIKQELPRPFIGIHLRNHNDWDRVCDHVPSKSSTQPLFASMQCDGEEFYDGQLTKEICSPSASTVVEQVVDMVGRIGARSVFVASDKDHMIETINEALRPYEVKAHRLNPDDALVSLAILGQADHFIGNCVSTFSHLVKRERTNSKPSRPTSYFGIRGQRRQMEL
ncbi:unnamed protein product [Heligmosomoides polygyrus]|uniref:GDP-fucose protein O-fucosyltransferase 1 n=1 Tax=Heligmosomoides polygyrus TaxID=6339 RepID=A0A3P8A166_HELPZ|nr:unnamed protein product [Heligmosomoides polygyrus]